MRRIAMHTNDQGMFREDKFVFFIKGIDMVQPYDMIQVKSNSDFGVKNITVQVYSSNHNSQSNSWIDLIFYVDSPDIFFYLGLKIKVNHNSGRYRNTGQQRLYKFCYILLYDL